MNTAGLYLQGWPADANGDITIDSANLTSLESINILNIASSAQATTRRPSINGNLNSDQVASARPRTYDPIRRDGRTMAGHL